MKHRQDAQSFLGFARDFIRAARALVPVAAGRVGFGRAGKAAVPATPT